MSDNEKTPRMIREERSRNTSPLVAHGVDKAGNVSGSILFPLDACRTCLPGAYAAQMGDDRVPLESEKPIELQHLDFKPGHVIFAGCNQYLSIAECPHFQRCQKGLRNGYRVVLQPYKP